MKYIIGNWKSNKNLREVTSWLDAYKEKDLEIFKSGVQIIIAPPYPFLLTVKDALKDTPWIKIASQDISQFGAGTYTGAVSSHNLDGLIDFAIIGHSERRKHFEESNATVASKAELAKSSDIEPVICVRGKEDIIPDGTTYIAYEPPGAISTGDGKGDAASVSDVIQMRQTLGITEKQKYIYGGSVNPLNIREYLENDQIDGVLPGGVSLDPEKFYELGSIAVSLTV